MTDAFLITTIVTIVLAFTGYMAAYSNGLRLAQRNQRLERVNKQLGELYGPCTACSIPRLLSSKSSGACTGREAFFSEEAPPYWEACSLAAVDDDCVCAHKQPHVRAYCRSRTCLWRLKCLCALEIYVLMLLATSLS